jgi:beta-N-acetylhexosaminidase
MALRLAIGLGAFGAVSLLPLAPPLPPRGTSPDQTLVAAARVPGNAAAASTIAAQDPRVEEALRGLTTDADRIGQLLLLGWVGTTAEEARPTLRELRPGGIVYVDNARTEAAASAINAGLLEISREIGLLAPLIAVDHEGGRVQRIVDVPNLGSNRDFAAGQPSDAQACERGLTHARQLRTMGFTMNLAPVLDVNNNPANPVIGDRSYGADPDLVARLGAAYVRGLQQGGVAAVGKHFPGHGNTSVDSHLQLPVLPQSEAQLEQVELVPFRRAIAADVDVAAIMSAHIVFPAVDPTDAPATLSRPIMTGLLRGALGFQGLVVSDDLAGMRAITDNFTPGQAAVRAVQAGVDLLIVAGSVPRQRESRDALLAALARGDLTRDRVDDALRHVLRVKARFGLLGEPASVALGCS